MYEAYFGLANLPFCIAPDSRFYVDAAPHRAAIQALQDRLGRGDEFMPLVGEYGVGKTTVGRRMLEEMDRGRHVAAELPRLRIEGDQLFDRVAEAFGLRRPAGGPPLASVIRQLEGFVRDGCDALLLVDEAHQLDISTLRRLRKLTAVRVDGRAALRVCLVGRSAPPGIEELRRIGQPLKIGAPVLVEPLDAAGTREYILERLGRAGWVGRPGFESAATAIHERCKGNPGRVNRLCGHILLQLYIQGRDDVNADVVRAVDALLQAELRGEPATLMWPPLAPAPAPAPASAPAPATPTPTPGPTAAPAPAPFLAQDAPTLTPLAAPVHGGLRGDALLTQLMIRTSEPPRPVMIRTSEPPRPGTGLMVASQDAPSTAHALEPRRRGLVAQGLAAVALLVSGGFLWQMISNLATAHSASTRLAAPRAPAAHDAAPARTVAANQPTSPARPLPEVDALLARAEAAIAQSPPGAGSSMPAATAAKVAAPRVPPRLPASRHASATAGREDSHVAPMRPAPARPVAAPAPCTLEGETLGLCNRSIAREPLRRAAPAPEPDPASDSPAGAVRTPPSNPTCEPARAALALCSDSPREAH